MKTFFVKALILAAFLTLLSGCKEEALTATVRSGDTVIVSLSADDLGGGAGPANTAILRRNQMGARITDSTGEQYDVKLRQVFKVYADPTSKVRQESSNALWLAAIDLVDPLSATAPALASGTASLTLTAPDYFASDKTVSLEVVPGLGSPKELSDLNLDPDAIEPARQALASVTGNLADHKLAAVEHLFVIPHNDGVDASTGEELTAAVIRKVPGQKSVNFNVQQTTTDSGSTEVRVYLTAIEGLAQSQLQELDIALISELPQANAQADYWQKHHQGSKYYGINGNQLSLTTDISVIR